MVTSTQLAPESLVARIIEEIESNPEAQRLLLRALLTEEFLRIPERLDRIEAELEVARTERADAKAERAEMRNDIATLKRDSAILKRDNAILKGDSAILKRDSAILKGDSLEIKLHRRVRSLVSQRLGLRRARIMQSAVQDTRPALSDAIEDAQANGIITNEQEIRIDATDIIVSALRKSDGSRVWVAIEVSNNVGQSDIERAQKAADALSMVFGEDAEGVAVGYRIHDLDIERADRLSVHTIIVPIPQLPPDNE